MFPKQKEKAQAVQSVKPGQFARAGGVADE
jgi:hypothetical protein